MCRNINYKNYNEHLSWNISFSKRQKEKNHNLCSQYFFYAFDHNIEKKINYKQLKEEGEKFLNKKTMFYASTLKKKSVKSIKIIKSEFQFEIGLLLHKGCRNRTH